MAINKDQTITLEFWRVPASKFEVQSITNSVAYCPGDWLSMEQVTALCASKDWAVTLVAPNFAIPSVPLPISEVDRPK